MKKIAINIVIILLFCFPYAYLALKTDFEQASMIGYIPLIGASIILSVIGTKYNCIPAVVVGNIVSLIVSHYFVSHYNGGESWDGYFKPFDATIMLYIIFILNNIPQLIIVLLIKRGMRRS